MKNTKKTLTVIISALICLSICACGNNSNTTTSAETSKTEASVTTTAESSETSESTTESNSETENDGKPGDPPDGQSGEGGTPPGDPPDGNGGPGGTPPDGNGGNPPDMPGGGGGGFGGGSSSADIDCSGAIEITSADSQSSQTYASDTADQSALLISGSTLTGCISGEITNSKGTTVSTEVGTVSVTLDSTSTWTLTGDTYISEFSGDASNIISNGYTLYVNGVALSGTR